MPSVDPDYGLGVIPVPVAYGPTNLGVLTADPDTASSNKGDFFLLDTTGKVRMFNGVSWQDLSVLTNAARVNAGNTFTTQQIIQTGGDTQNALRLLRNSATQSQPIFRILDSNGTTVLSQFDQNGALSVRNDNGAAATVPLSVTANASQSVNLFQVLASDNSTVRFGVGSAGAVTVQPGSGTALTVNGAASGIGLRVNPNAAGSDTARFYHTNATNFSAFSNAGNLIIRTNNNSWTPTASMQVDSSNVGLIGVIVQGDSGQTADLQRWQTKLSGGTVFSGVNAVGQIYTGSTAPINGSTATITQTSVTAGVDVVYTTSAAHNFAVGDLVTISGITTAQGLPGSNPVSINTVPTSNTFSVLVTTGTSGSYTSLSGTATVPAQASVTARSASTVGLVVRAAASQSVRLSQWQNSSGTEVAAVSSGGGFVGSFLQTIATYVQLNEENSGGFVRITKQTAAGANPGAGIGKLYFRDGTTAGTLKLVARAGASGDETPILDNIGQTAGVAGTIDGGTA